MDGWLDGCVHVCMYVHNLPLVGTVNHKFSFTV